MNFKRYVYKNNLGTINKKEYFKNLTTMRVGGKIKYLYYPNSVDSLKQSIYFLNKKKIKYIFIGNGSNIIASERFYDGVVICSKNLPHTVNIDRDIITVTAFYDLRRLVSFTVSRGINTFTKLAGIPATVGGAIFMNASANSLCISDHLVSVVYLKNNTIYTKKKEEIDFAYRHSEFQENNCIILEASFKVIKKDEVLVDYNNCLLKRKQTQPLIFPNSGSIFRNNNNKKAYEIIQELKLAGYCVGKAQVSLKHCNFIINTGRAKGEEIYRIIKKVKRKAKRKNYLLKEEVILFNFKK